MVNNILLFNFNSAINIVRHLLTVRFLVTTILIRLSVFIFMHLSFTEFIYIVYISLCTLLCFIEKTKLKEKYSKIYYSLVSSKVTHIIYLYLLTLVILLGLFYLVIVTLSLIDH